MVTSIGVIRDVGFSILEENVVQEAVKILEARRSNRVISNTEEINFAPTTPF